MTTPSVTLRSLKNEDTGIDIHVPRFQEEEAPLGGISILYEIAVFTRLDLFKTRLHKSGDIVHFTIFKAYREFDDLYNKLNKKYPKAGLPPVPKASSVGKYTSDEKVEALDNFMSGIAKNSEICYSSIFTQFIGINSQRLPSFSRPNPESVDNSDSLNENVAQAEQPAEVKKEPEDIPEIFPKMKNTFVEKNQTLPVTVKNIDLFEEVKLNKEAIVIDVANRNASKGLFDDFEDDSLFSSKPAEKKPSKAPEEKPKEKPVVIKKPETTKRKVKEPIVQNVDDSQIILKDRKPGDMSLFEDQDFGDFITKEEESLFLVTSPNTEAKKNILLFSEDEMPSPESENSVNENLDDLLHMEPLPNSPFPNKKELVAEPPEVEKDPPKPVPLPRKKSLGIIETDSQPKPEVMPRKVFLNKTSSSTAPEVSVRPPVPAKKPPHSSVAAQTKPTVPPKPKPPPKKPNLNVQNQNTERNLDAANANEVAKPENANTFSEPTSDLKELDILKYIEQEEKSLNSPLGLFD